MSDLKSFNPLFTCQILKIGHLDNAKLEGHNMYNHDQFMASQNLF